MKILDRYITSRYVMKLLWAITMATTVFLVVDLVEMMDNFIDKRVPVATIFRYYYLYIPYIIYLILPVATLLATLFTVGGLTMTNELSAMFVSGIPFHRPLGLLLITTCLVAFAGFILGETIVPETNRKRMDIERYEVKKLPRDVRSRHGELYMQIAPAEQLQVRRYNPDTYEAFGIQVVEISNGKISKRTDAEKMVWRDSEWRLQGVIHRSFTDSNEVVLERNIPMSIDARGIRPDELEKVQTAPEEMNFAELKSFVNRLKSMGASSLRWEVDLLFKVSLPVAAIIIVLFGAPIASIRRRSGPALGFGLALFICFIYFGFIQVGKVLGYNGLLPPVISAWIGNFFFGLLGIGILGRWVR